MAVHEEALLCPQAYVGSPQMRRPRVLVTLNFGMCATSQRNEADARSAAARFARV
jgi:hypothetical protein